MTEPVDEADVVAAFEMMRINHPRIPGVHRKFDMARKAARNTPLSPKRYIEFFAPTCSGKSTAIKTYIEDKVVDEAIAKGLFPADMDRAQIAAQQRLVLHVTLSPNASVRSLASDILTQLGDRKANEGDGPVLIRRVYEYLSGTYRDPATGLVQPRQTELVILDEIQHLGSSKTRHPDGRTEKMHKMASTLVTDTLKVMMIRGLCPMVFVGIPEAREFLAIDTQLTGRAVATIDFSPLRWSSDADQAIFLEYCVEAASLIKSEGLLPEETDLMADEIPHRLWAASSGCVGVVSRILEQAVMHALARNATCVGYEDLALAVDTRTIPSGMCTYNPFREGVREVEIAA